VSKEKQNHYSTDADAGPLLSSQAHKTGQHHSFRGNEIEPPSPPVLLSPIDAAMLIAQAAERRHIERESIPLFREP